MGVLHVVHVLRQTALRRRQRDCVRTARGAQIIVMARTDDEPVPEVRSLDRDGLAVFHA